MSVWIMSCITYSKRFIFIEYIPLSLLHAKWLKIPVSSSKKTDACDSYCRHIHSLVQHSLAHIWIAKGNGQIKTAFSLESLSLLAQEWAPMLMKTKAFGSNLPPLNANNYHLQWRCNFHGMELEQHGRLMGFYRV